MIPAAQFITMQTPWVNIALLALILLQVITGYFGFTNGRPPDAWLLWLHGIGAYALILLMVFKAGIILDAWRRKKRWTGKRRGFLVLLVLLILTTAMGLAWTFIGPVYIGGFSLVSLHIYVALVVLGLMLWHAWHMRFIWRVPEATGRRLFLGSVLAAVGGFLAWGTVGRVKAWRGWPGALRRFTGSYETGSYSGQFPSVSWIADQPPVVDIARWQLVVTGFVGNPLVLGYDDFIQLPQVELEATLDCTGGWYTSQIWRGVRVGELLARAGVRPEAASITFESSTGYKRRFGLVTAENYLLATGILAGFQGELPQPGAIFKPLPPGNGYPLRLVAPGERGVEWVKWISAIHVNETGPNLQMPLPIQ